MRGFSVLVFVEVLSLFLLLQFFCLVSHTVFESNFDLCLLDLLPSFSSFLSTDYSFRVCSFVPRVTIILSSNQTGAVIFLLKYRWYVCWAVKSIWESVIHVDFLSLDGKITVCLFRVLVLFVRMNNPGRCPYGVDVVL